MSTLRVGGNVDSWCGKCRLMLAHTIEAMVETKIVRVHCNTCGAVHAYKAHAPGTAPRKSSRPGPSRAEAGARRAMAGGPGLAKASHYAVLIEGRNPDAAGKYSPRSTYVQNDLIDHPKFGLGIAVAVKSATKVEVLFAEGAKTLVHGR